MWFYLVISIKICDIDYDSGMMNMKNLMVYTFLSQISVNAEINE